MDLAACDVVLVEVVNELRVLGAIFIAASCIAGVGVGFFFSKGCR